MSRYIDADALRDKLYEADAVTMRGVAIINNEPTVDAVPVVRCGKCKRRYKPLDDDARNEIYCEFMGSTMQKDDFCSHGCADGERRTE